MKKRRNFLWVLGGLALVGGSWFVREQLVWEGTDDAYVQAHVLMLAPRVAGTVSKVLVDENEEVKAGQLLVQFDGQDYATAQSQAQADTASLQADLRQAQADFDRAKKLLADGVVTQQQYDQAQARSNGLAQRLRAAEFKAKQAQLNVG